MERQSHRHHFIAMQPVSMPRTNSAAAPPVGSVRVVAQVPGALPLGARIVTVQSPVKGTPQSLVSSFKQVVSPGAANLASPIKVASVNGVRQVVMMRPSGSFQAPAPLGSIKAVPPAGSGGMQTQSPVMRLAQPNQVHVATPSSPVKTVVQAQSQRPAVPQRVVSNAKATKAASQPQSQEPKTDRAPHNEVDIVQKDVQLPVKATASSQPSCCFNFVGKLSEMASPKSSKELSVGGFAKVRTAGPHCGTTAKITKTNGHAFKVGGKWYLAEELQPMRG